MASERRIVMELTEEEWQLIEALRRQGKAAAMRYLQALLTVIGVESSASEAKFSLASGYPPHDNNQERQGEA